MPAVHKATVDIYEQQAAEYRARRPPKYRRQARAFAGRVLTDGPVVDLGCGPGTYLGDLGRGAVGLDAAGAMLDLAAEAVPGAALVQADVEALPFRDRSLGGAWARNTYLHVPRASVPLALARLHWALAPGAPAEITFDRGSAEGLEPAGDFPGRWMSSWEPDDLEDVLVGAGFEVEAIEDVDDLLWSRARRARTLPDTVGPGMRVLVCGLNPSLFAADAGLAFARPGNRFWPAAVEAGLVSRSRDPLHALLADGVGTTDLVKRATVAAGELSADEYRSGAERMGRLVAWLRPALVLFVGMEGWRKAVDRHAAPGLQPGRFAGAPAYVMPSTSGLNAHARLADLVEHMRAAVAASGEG
jgi:double-stranded uracil-DNA glycosylase